MRTASRESFNFLKSHQEWPVSTGSNGPSMQKEPSRGGSGTKEKGERPCTWAPTQKRESTRLRARLEVRVGVSVSWSTRKKVTDSAQGAGVKREHNRK